MNRVQWSSCGSVGSCTCRLFVVGVSLLSDLSKKILFKRICYSTNLNYYRGYVHISTSRRHAIQFEKRRVNILKKWGCVGPMGTLKPFVLVIHRRTLDESDESDDSDEKGKSRANGLCERCAWSRNILSEWYTHLKAR